MLLLEIFLQFYFVLFLVRLLIPDTGQMTFNRTYQLVVKLSQPIVSILGKPFPARMKFLSPLLAILILMFLQGLIYGGYGAPERVLDIGLERWQFKIFHPFWGPAKSLAFYLVFLYRLFALLLLIASFPYLRSSSDQFSRLVRKLVQPFLNLGRGGFAGLGVVAIIFSLVLVLLWKLYEILDVLDPPDKVIPRSVLCSTALVIDLLIIFVYLIIVRTLLSWLSLAGIPSGASGWLEIFTEPFLQPFRKLGLQIGAWDLTPVAAILFLLVLKQILFILLNWIHHLVVGV